MTASSSSSRVGMAWLCLAAAALLAASFVWSAEGMPRFHVCYMYRFTGIPCPGCGLTRAFCAISHGRFAQARHHNPFGFVFYGLAVATLVWPVLARLFPGAEQRVVRSRAIVVAPILLVAAMWVYGLGRALNVVMGGR